MGERLVRSLRSLACLVVLIPFPRPATAQDDAAGLKTRWADEVLAGERIAAYPRPMLERERWLSLDGSWQLAIQDRGEPAPEVFEQTIRVPFPIESLLSGVSRRISHTERAWYRRTVQIPEDWQGQRVLLQFGAVDWEAVVWVNHRRQGEHRGGYDPFWFDITDSLRPDGDQEIVVAVWDPTDQGTQPRGKQVSRPGGIWYTPTTGIWQTVWLEPVPAEGSLETLTIDADLDAARVTVRAQVSGGQDSRSLRVSVLDDDRGVVAQGTGADAVSLSIPGARAWSPDSPTLYRLEVRLERDGGRLIDRVSSWFGLRKVELKKDAQGKPRIFLNGEPLFQLGLLDQGFWPDGLYTAPTDAALRSDVETSRELGFNMIRKHVKVEPARWYHHCDRLGILVWQDMPSGDRSIGASDEDLERSADSARQFDRELEAVIAALRNHPSIVVWVPFNEGWGQFDTARVTRRIGEIDPDRLVISASGWTDRGTGDLSDVHSYPGPGMGPVEETRAQVLGEFGGLGLPLPGHTWQDEKNWGYRNLASRAELTSSYERLLRDLRFLIPEGLAGAVYTQTTDVEIEVNGLLTYDREVVKIAPERARSANLSVHRRAPRVLTVVSDSQREPVEWRYTLSRPPAGWTRPEFDDSSWKRGMGGFGRQGTPGAVVRTDWSSGEIWLRREFRLSSPIDRDGLALRIHHDEDVEIHFNGQQVLTRNGYTTAYLLIDLEAEAAPPLKPGQNLLAVHCRQTGGGQYIDVGLVRIEDG